MNLEFFTAFLAIDDSYLGFCINDTKEIVFSPIMDVVNEKEILSQKKVDLF
jgi:hypothetical protein